MSVARYFNPKLRAGLLQGTQPEWLQRHPRRSYIIAAIISAPDWADRAGIEAKRREAKAHSIKTGVEHVLDHIVPLNSPIVCGLTVSWNFDITTRKANAAKSNHMWPGHPCEPMRLF